MPWTIKGSPIIGIVVGATHLGVENGLGTKTARSFPASPLSLSPQSNNKTNKRI